MNYTASVGTLNPTRSLIHSLTCMQGEDEEEEEEEEEEEQEKAEEDEEEHEEDEEREEEEEEEEDEKETEQADVGATESNLSNKTPSAVDVQDEQKSTTADQTEITNPIMA